MTEAERKIVGLIWIIVQNKYQDVREQFLDNNPPSMRTIEDHYNEIRPVIETEFKGLVSKAPEVSKEEIINTIVYTVMIDKFHMNVVALNQLISAAGIWHHFHGISAKNKFQSAGDFIGITKEAYKRVHELKRVAKLKVPTDVLVKSVPKDF